MEYFQKLIVNGLTPGQEKGLEESEEEEHFDTSFATPEPTRPACLTEVTAALRSCPPDPITWMPADTKKEKDAAAAAKKIQRATEKIERAKKEAEKKAEKTAAKEAVAAEKAAKKAAAEKAAEAKKAAQKAASVASKASAAAATGAIKILGLAASMSVGKAAEEEAPASAAPAAADSTVEKGQDKPSR